MRILFSSSFVYKSHNGAAIFAQLFIKWAISNDHHLDVISIETTPDFHHIDEPSSNIPIHYQRKLSKSIYDKIKSLDYASYDLIFFNNIIEASYTLKKLTHSNIQGFLHDSQYMNDVYPHQNIKRKLFRRALKSIEKKAINKLKKVHTNSVQMKKQIHQTYKTPINKISFLYFSSLDLFPKVRIQKEAFTILFIKTNYVSGGLFTLLNACNKLPFPTNIIAVGPDEKSHPEIKSAYPDLSIKLYNYKSRSDIHLLFSETDVFITPAITEPMGIGNLEAMKMDVPVIGNSVEGIKEIGEKSKAILLFKKNDSDDLAKKIIQLNEDDKLKRALIENGRKFIKTHLEKEIIFNKFNQLFY